MNAKSFRIGSVDYTVEMVPKLYHLYERLGQVIYGNTHIQLDADMSPSRINDVLIHELLHAIFCEAGYDDQDEDTINRVGKVLAQVLRDNDFGFMRQLNNEEESE
ncbi:MAG: ImmA/IrrE family metallo-endopeptidase [Bacillota bacterium]